MAVALKERLSWLRLSAMLSACWKHLQCHQDVSRAWAAIFAVAICLLHVMLGGLLLARHSACCSEAVISQESLAIVVAGVLLADPVIMLCLVFARLWCRDRWRASNAKREVCRDNSKNTSSLFSKEALSAYSLKMTDVAAGRRVEADEKKHELVEAIRALFSSQLQHKVGPKLLHLTREQATCLDRHCNHMADQIESIIADFEADSDYPWMHDLESFLLRSPSPARCRTKLEANINIGEMIARQSEGAVIQQHAQAYSPQKKLVKLSDREILTLYDSAQREAQVEADWRGIDWQSKVLDKDPDGFQDQPRPHHISFSHDTYRTTSKDDEYLRILSIAARESDPEPPESCLQVLDNCRPDATLAVDVQKNMCCHSPSGNLSCQSPKQSCKPLQRPPSPVAPPLLP